MSNRGKFIVRNLLAIVMWVALFIVAMRYINLPGDSLRLDGSRVAGVLRWFTVIVFAIVLPVLWVIWTFDGFAAGTDEEREEGWYEGNADTTMLKYVGFKRLRLGWIFTLLLLCTFLYSATVKSVGIYNKSVQYNVQYSQLTKQRLGYFDNMWKTYLQKDKITNLNKEAFVQVTQLIMENRRDGQNLAWKWLQENQQIPYGEFVKFYQDLSSFVESQRQGYYDLEVQCQSVASAHNMLIDTFPNNWYNDLLVHRKHIKFEYGLLSDSTNKVFATGKEDPR
jgi:hypothetical protein